MRSVASCWARGPRLGSGCGYSCQREMLRCRRSQGGWLSLLLFHWTSSEAPCNALTLRGGVWRCSLKSPCLRQRFKDSSGP
ncbi:hypothetical protein CRUP_028829 [Coryphaenoides rupestris]|nr:hypothetical protein CRUP_028829 [Coryphaenoides rupestris]